MADWYSWVRQQVHFFVQPSRRLLRAHFTQIYVLRGILLSWGSEDDVPGQLQLWYNERISKYYIRVKATYYNVDKAVCKVDVFTLHFEKCTDKIKTLLTKKSKFHFIQY